MYDNKDISSADVSGEIFEDYLTRKNYSADMYYEISTIFNWFYNLGYDRNGNELQYIANKVAMLKRCDERRNNVSII